MQKENIKKKIRQVLDIILESYYIGCRNHMSIEEDTIVLESKNGMDFASNIFYLLKELGKENYKKYKIIVVVTKTSREKIEEKIRENDCRKVKYVTLYSPGYYKAMATAKYIFTDTSLERVYVKRDGQIIVNTWHGTPLKYMGRDEKKSAYAMWNIQRNFFMSDYLLYPNRYMMNVMTKAYGLEQLYKGNVLLTGYPRNAVFFQEEGKEELKEKLGLKEKEVFMYMPTWRGTVDDKKGEEFLREMLPVLDALDRQLKDNQVLYVKLHPFVEAALSLDSYTHIRAYQEKMDIYEFLTVCDCLITDYSSIFFDFANTGKKIILFQYDRERYEAERGMYLSFSDFPFPIVSNAEELIHEMNLPKQYDDTAFLEKYCTYDNVDAAKNLCEHILSGKAVCEEFKLEKNGKENVLMYGLELGKNGITTALLNLWKQMDLKKRNYFVGVDETALQNAPERIQFIPEQVGFFPTENKVHPTILEAVAYYFYFKKDKKNGWIEKYIDRLFQREVTRRFCGIQIDYGVQFAGYEVKHVKIFEHLPCPRSIFVHNDMYEESVHKKMMHYPTIQSAYQNYDKVAVVTEDIIPPTLKVGGRKENLVVVNNCVDYLDIRSRAEQEIVFHEETKSSVSLEELKQILNSDAKKFITIGRFSKEKGHRMLMEAFEEFSMENPETYLIIIGGYGPIYEETYAYAMQSKAKIVVLYGMRNPMPVLKQCDFFLLSSFYEGLGLALLEANILGLPVLSTDIPGPRGFMKAHGGHLVPPTREGLLEGMKAYQRGEILPMKVDYASYNSNAVNQFEQLFDTRFTMRK